MRDDAESPVFPAGFLFGAATSAHQVEGGNSNNNWALWERQGRGERCGRAVDHWNRFNDDLALMRWLGLDVYRFSVEWSRVELLPGCYDDDVIERYREWCAALRAAGIAPMVTLHHFTEPAWAADRGGFENPAIGEAWVRFVERVVPRLADLVDLWITINEPVGYAVQGWWRGEWPPGRTDPRAALRVVENLLVAHAEAYRVIHRLDTVDADGDGAPCAVGLAHNIVVFRPRRRFNPLDRLAARRLDLAYNRAVLEALRTGRFSVELPDLAHHAVHDELRRTQDFLGLNHYYPMAVAFRPSVADRIQVGFTGRGARNDLGWPLEPTSLVEALDIVAPYELPVIITEHGACDADEPDVRRRKFLADSLHELRAAMARGADVRGYVHWSLMDNFEWAYGFSPRFGLFRVDRRALDRSATTTAHLYRDVITASRAATRGGTSATGG